MIDFHSHILPGIDDGSKDFETSLKMIKISIDEGVECICATPHFIPEEHEIKRTIYDERLEELKKNKLGEQIKILSGLEVYINPTLPKLYKENKIWCINDRKYMLIELPMNQFPIYTEEVFYELRILGVTPILAHPERNIAIIKDEELLINLIRQGAIAQMNSGSLRGLYGEKVQEFSKHLVKRNLIHVLGSDGHNITGRKTKLKEGYNILRELNESLYRNIIVNERKIMEGEDIEILPIKEYKEGFINSLLNMFKKK